MFSACEPIAHGMEHVPFNAALLRTICFAFPNDTILSLRACLRTNRRRIYRFYCLEEICAALQRMPALLFMISYSFETALISSKQSWGKESY